MAKSAPIKRKATKTVKPAKPKPSKVSKATNLLFAHWLHDASIENAAPLQAFPEGARQVDLTIRVHKAPLQHPTHQRLDMRLRAHIVMGSNLIALAEIRYAAIVDKAQFEAKPEVVLGEIYPHGRGHLLQILKLAGHEPPIPVTLDLNKTKVS